MKYAELVNSVKPFQLNFLPLNYWDAAAQLAPESYENLSNAIKSAIDVIDKSIHINVRYIPFCFMLGYEKYVVGTYQLIFDQDDWNMITYDIEHLHKVPNPKIQDYFDRARDIRNKSYNKKSECFSCKYFSVCDGVEHSIDSVQKVYPVEGDVIKDVLHYKRQSKLKVESSKNSFNSAKFKKASNLNKSIQK